MKCNNIDVCCDCGRTAAARVASSVAASCETVQWQGPASGIQTSPWQCSRCNIVMLCLTKHHVPRMRGSVASNLPTRRCPIGFDIIRRTTAFQRLSIVSTYTRSTRPVNDCRSRSPAETARRRWRQWKHRLNNAALRVQRWRICTCEKADRWMYILE